MRLAVHGVKRYAFLKLNDQNIQDDVTITHPEHKKLYMENSQTLYSKIT